MIWNRLWSVRNQSYECGRFFFITLAKKLKNLSWKDGWFRRWYVFAFKHTQTKLPTFYECLLPFLILTINTSKQFKVASILLSQFKCITILWFLSEDLYTGEVCCRLSHICTQSDECILSDGPKKYAWTHHMTVSHPHYYNHHWFFHYSTCPLKFIHIHNYEANLE